MIDWTKIITTIVIAISVNLIVYQILFSDIIKKDFSEARLYELDSAINEANTYNELVDAINRMRK